MTTFKSITVLALLGLLMIASSVASQEDVTEIMKKSHLAYYYAGDDGIAEVHMSIMDKRGKERVREFTMLRMDESEGGNQKYYTYFHKPSDVARLTFMVHKNTDGNDQRWIYVPAVDLIKPISADDKNSSFVGSEFSYEDVSGRRWTEDSHTMVGDSTVDEKAVFVIESTPIDKGYNGFAKKISFIDKATYLPLLERYYDDKGELIRIFRAEKTDTVDGILTVTTRSMEDVKKERKTTIVFEGIKYNQGLSADIFTERYLKSPPRQYIN